MKKLFFIALALCFINIAVAQVVKNPIVRVIPASAALKDKKICDYILVVENFPKGELFVVSDKLFHRDFGKFGNEVYLKNSSLFFVIKAQDYPVGESVSLHCLDIMNQSGTEIYFTPNPIDSEEFFPYEIQVERTPEIIEGDYIRLESEKLYTLADLEEVNVDDVVLSLDSDSKTPKVFSPPPFPSLHPSALNRENFTKITPESFLYRKTGKNNPAK